MHTLILHHYDRSPFSEKVRLMFGLKGLAWQSVVVPMILPKPDLIPLTGGYRRTPVLQIGADIYCDTDRIAAELERRFPEPTLFPGRSNGLCGILSMWAERVLFWPTARYVTAINTDRLPDAFHADRAAMRGHAVPDPEQLRAEAPYHLIQLQLQLGSVEQMLSDGREYVLGDRPSLADFAIYGRVWWLGAFGGGERELELFPRIQAWAHRIAAIGHGVRQDVSAQEALAIAAATEPEPPPIGHAPASCLYPGEHVTITTEGYGPDPVTGELVYATADAVGLRRVDERLGEIVVHFPRSGYTIRPA